MPALLPPVPAINGDGDEHDLTGGLSPQRGGGGCTKDVAQEDREQKDVTDDADRPSPDFSAHAAEGAEEPKDVSKHFA
ncbi:hypothetical protein D3C73_1290170 [compost metagenome]